MQMQMHTPAALLPRYLLLLAFFLLLPFAAPSDIALLLAKVKPALQGAAATPNAQLATWNASTPLCLWRGLRWSTPAGQPLPCHTAAARANLSLADDPTLLLVSIRLPAAALAGRLPPDLGAFSALASLYLAANSLSGPIPLELGNAPALSDLDLAGNALSGVLPPSIWNLCDRLAVLRLHGNALTGAIPTPAEPNTTCDRLRLLDLGVNRFSGDFPSFLTGFRGLQSLDLGGNRLSGSIPDSLAGMRGLQTLNFSYNNFSGQLPPGFADSAFTAESFLGNNPSLCGPPLRQQCVSPSGLSSRGIAGMVIGLMAGAVVVASVSIGWALGRWRRNRVRRAAAEGVEADEGGEGKPVVFQGREHLTLEEVRNATGQVVEKASYCTVYKAKLADGGGNIDPNAAAPAGGDWRAQLQPEARHRIVNKIMETLKKHLPVSVPEGLNELQKIAVRFEEKIYTAASNQSDYIRKISLKMLSMETKTQQPPGNAQVIPNQNPSGSAPGLPPQGSNPAQSSAIPLMSQQQAQQPNSSTSVQASLSNLGQSLPGVGQTSALQNMSGVTQNTMNNGLAQGSSQDIYAAQRQMAGRQQQQQQSHNQLIYQQQQMAMKQKLQQNSLMQPHIQQQQSLLQSTQMQSSQQAMMQMSSGLQTLQSTIPQTQPMAMQSTTQSGIQQNPLNSVQQSVQSLLQPPPQSVVRQQQQPQPSMHQQPSLQQAQPTQQPNIPLQQQLMGQQPSLQQNQLIGQQNGAVEMQQQQRLPVQPNNLLNIQQTQQMLNQQSMPLHQSHQLGSQANMPSLQQQQQNQQQQQLLGTVPNVSNIQRMHMLQTKASVQQPQQQQHAQQPSMGLMQPQSQHNQLQQSQQHLMSQYQSQPNQLQQQLGMQQQPSMQQRLQTSAGMLLQQNNIDQQKQFIQAHMGLQEVSSSTSVDSTAQTGHAGAGDWQEEIYQMVKSLKDQYFAELSELYNKISVKLQHVDSMIPPPKPSEQYERMKNFKIMLERTLQVLQINKNNIQPALREKVPTYERQIISILNSQRRKPVQTQGQQQFQQSTGQAPSSNISQQQQPSHDNRTNQMPQASLPSMSTGLHSSSAAGIQHEPAPPATNFGGPTTQQNVANASQAASNLEAAEGSNFNSSQHGSTSGALQQGSTGPMQSTMNAQQQASSSMLSHNSMSTMQPNANSMQANASSLQQPKQQQQEHHMNMMQNHQMKRQMPQQLQQKQMLQQQLPIQQQLQKQQQAQIQVPQLHSGNDVNELKGAAMKTGIYQQHLGQRSNYYHQQLKKGGAFPISSPQNLQASSPQISHHSPQVDQHNLLLPPIKTGTPLHSANSPFVPSPSPSVAPSPIPVDSDKPLSNISSLTNTGQAGHQQTSLAPQTQSIAVNTPGISASPLLAEFTSADGSQANIPTQVPTKSSAAERPLDRLLKVLQTTPRQSLSAAVSDIGSVVSMIDRIAGSAPGNGSRAAVGEDLVAMTKCRLQARNFITHDGSGTSKKMKRDTSAMPLNVSSAGSVNDSFKQTYSVDTPELQSTATSHAKLQKTEVNHALVEEIQEINQQLIDTELHVCEDVAESFAATSEGAEGTVIKCTFTAVAVSPSLKSMFASARMSPILPLRLLVPAGYPKCSPVLLDKFPDEQRNSDDLTTKAKSKFGMLMRGLPEPMSLQEIARTWDACARKVIAEYAQQTGGGSFSSSYGCWESCVGA